MSNFHMKKPQLRTVDILGLIFLVGAATGVSGAILWEAMQNDKPRQARGTIQALTQQIITHHMRQRSPTMPLGRGPASEGVRHSAMNLLTAGTIGIDPWGHPYRYLVRKEETALAQQKLRGWVYVWSDGPNGRSDGDPASIASTPPEGGEIRLNGDDLGQSVEFFTDL